MRRASSNQTVSFISCEPIDATCSVERRANLSIPGAALISCWAPTLPALYASAARGSDWPAIVPPVSKTMTRGNVDNPAEPTLAAAGHVVAGSCAWAQVERRAAAVQLAATSTFTIRWCAFKASGLTDERILRGPQEYKCGL